jgi:hypothetical protein
MHAWGIIVIYVVIEWEAMHANYNRFTTPRM